MIPVTITSRAPNLRHRRRQREAWEARSHDGVWLFERLEQPGTPWLTTHQPSGFQTTFASLRKAQRGAHRELALALVTRLCELAVGR